MLCIGLLAAFAAVYEIAAATDDTSSAPAPKAAATAAPEPTAPAPSASGATSPSPSPSATCLECHTDETLAMEKNGRTVPLFVTAETVAKSAHGAFDCVDCHEGLD